jgi:uncharacterized membrane protein YidH (DUF202 family)
MIFLLAGILTLMLTIWQIYQVRKAWRTTIKYSNKTDSPFKLVGVGVFGSFSGVLFMILTICFIAIGISRIMSGQIWALY